MPQRQQRPRLAPRSAAQSLRVAANEAIERELDASRFAQCGVGVAMNPHNCVLERTLLKHYTGTEFPLRFHGFRASVD
jgi:hypothetical protein